MTAPKQQSFIKTLKRKTPTVAETLRRLGACEEAITWSKQYGTNRTRAWNECRNGSHMLWIIGRTISCDPWTDGRKPFLASCLDCADLVKHLRPKARAKQIADAVKVLRKWIKGKATAEEAKKVKDQLCSADAAAAYAAADDAAAAAYAYAAAAADAYAYAAAAADAAAYAAAAAKKKTLAKCAVIVRQYYPKPPTVKP